MHLPKTVRAPHPQDEGALVVPPAFAAEAASLCAVTGATGIPYDISSLREQREPSGSGEAEHCGPSLPHTDRQLSAEGFSQRMTPRALLWAEIRLNTVA